jgi:rod shape-determining protein MreC
MNRRNQTGRFTTILIVMTLISPFIYFSLSLKPWNGRYNLATLMQEILYPVELGWNGLVEVTVETWDEYFANVAAAKENSRLRKEIDQLRAKFLTHDELVQEAGRLRKIVGFADHLGHQVIPTQVVGIPHVQGFVSARVNRGDFHGVFPGMPVVTPEGVAGRVIRVASRFSDVQIVSDPNFALDVILQRTRVRGVLHGSGDGRCTLQLSRSADIKIDDTVVTSGVIGGFPKGLPVGKVIRISYEADNISQKITVEPWIDIRTLEELLIINKVDSTLQKIIETAGMEWLKKSLEGVSGG